MFRYLTSFILLGLSVAIFMLFTSPIYSSIQGEKEKQSTYDEASTNSVALERERDKLTAKYSTISTENLDRIKKFLPDSVDNIRLILEIEKIAQPYGMVLKDVEYSVIPKDKEESVGSSIIGGANGEGDFQNKNYGSWDLGFSTTGTYANFLNFMRDLESNLRIVDISSIEFSSTNVGAVGLGGAEVYRYTFNIKTYWLKN